MWKIPLFKICWDQGDIDQVSEVIRSGMNWATGPKVQEFETKIAEFVGTKYAVTFNSGTSGLHAQLLAHGIKKGDEVLVPSFTFIATANAAKFVEAKPVFADIENDTYGLDPADVNERITKKTKAIIPVHVGGQSCKIRELKEIADDHNILLIEDAAEALGATAGGQNVGTFGESAMFSFCGPKVITTGEGGVVTTDSVEIFEKLKLLRSHGRAETKDYFSTTEYLDYVDLGYNFRMSNITAALGLAQLDKHKKIVEIRRNHAAYLSKQIKKKTNSIKTPVPYKDFFHMFQMYTIEAPDRDGLMKYLAEQGIMSKVYFTPVHTSHYYKNVLQYKPSLPQTDAIAKKVLTLPMYPDLTKEDLDYMASKIAGYYQGDA
jgi:perosamine synthetase